jgi:hypothetical protein
MPPLNPMDYVSAGRARSSSASSSTSATVTVSSGWRRTPKGSRPRTGVRNEISTPRSPLVANVRPRSVTARRAGPAVFQNAYGPVTATSLMLASGVETRHGPKRATSVRWPTSTHAVAGPTPNARANKRYAGANAKPKRLRCSRQRCYARDSSRPVLLSGRG